MAAGRDSTPNFEAQVHPPNKVLALLEVVQEAGLSPTALLEGTGLTVTALEDPALRLSYRQMQRTYANGAAMQQYPGLALMAGQRVHLTATGLYGYAFICSPNMREVCRFAVDYHRVTGPMTQMGFSETPEGAVWTYEPLWCHDRLDPLYRFTIEFQTSISYTVGVDVFGPEFVPVCIRAAYPKPAHAALYQSVFRCPAYFDQATNEQVQHARWLDHPPQLGNGVTYEIVRRTCDEILERMDTSPGLAGQVQQALLSQPGLFIGMEAVAEHMGMSARTLRRRLEAEDTSYQAILREVRSHLAQRYLKETSLSTEQIALRLGFSETANFRHAFKRWTGQQPGAFRSGR